MIKKLTLPRLLNELNRLYACSTSGEFLSATQLVLANTVPCDLVGWFDVTEQTTVRAYDHWLDGLAKEYENFEQLVDEIFLLHPFTGYFLSGGTKRVLRLSDSEGSSEWHNHPLFEPIAKSYSARFLLGARIVRPGDGFIALAIGRSNKDFSDEEMASVEEILQHIERHAVSLGLIPAVCEDSDRPTTETCRKKLVSSFNLTPREAEVAYWAASGKTNQDISNILQISPHTVRTHLHWVFEKMMVENRAALAHTAWNL